MKIFAGFLCGTIVAASAFAQTASPAAGPSVSCSAISLGSFGALNGFVPSPNDAWHKDISNAAVDPSSTKIMTTSGDLGYRYLHPDFGSGSYGIPYTVVDSSRTPAVPFTNLNYPAESDVAYYPLPDDMPIEGSPGDCPTDGGDRHAIVIDRNSCVIYELYQAGKCSTSKPTWNASNGAIWDMTLSEQRPYGVTSADAAGLSVFEGLLRYDEIAAGVVNHAIRFTANHTKNDSNGGWFVAPATHAAGTLWGTDNIIGMRIRLKADFDISGFSATNQIILKAMKQYGMILADNGSDMFFQGTPDPRWDDDDLNSLKRVPSSAFEVLQMTTPLDSVTAPVGLVPIINSFNASQVNIASGQSVVLSSNTTGASYTYIDNAGFTRGAVTVAPTATTTYTLTARNAYGTTTASVTVNVSNVAPRDPGLSFGTLADRTFGVAPFTVTAASSSSGAISYSVVSGPAVILGNTVTVIGVGTVTLQASQAAYGNYSAATATTSFKVTAMAASRGIWIGNGTGTLSTLADNGSPTSPNAGYSAGGMGVAVDRAGSIWSAGAGSLTRISASGALDTFVGGGIASPAAIAISGTGAVWLANGNGTLSAFTGDGIASSPAAGLLHSSLSGVSSLAIDFAGNLWVANKGNDTVTEFLGAADPVVTPVSLSVSGSTQATRP